MDVTLLTDDRREIWKVIRERKLCFDPNYEGETRALADNAGILMNFFSTRGMTLDEAGEAIWDAGITLERPDINSTIELLEWALYPPGIRRTGRLRRRKAFR